MRDFGLIVGRVLIGALFVIAGVDSIRGWDGVCTYFSSTMVLWQQSAGPESFIAQAAKVIGGQAPLFVGLAVLFKIAGGLSVSFGIQTRIGATLLILFLVPATLLMHPFWMMTNTHDVMINQILLLKNVGILGGLFYVAILGNGREYEM
jgi:putative oxidoreductase